MPRVENDDHVSLGDLSLLVPALPVLAGALMVVVGSLPALALGVDGGSWLMGLLVAGAMVMLALSVAQERLSLLVLGAANVMLVVTGAWLAVAGAVSVTPIFVWHMALVGMSLVWPVTRRDYRTRVWLGGELGLLVLAASLL